MNENSKTSKIYLEKLGAVTKTKAFLGREFLTWLWFQTENRSGAFKLASSLSTKTLTVELWIDDRIFLQPYDKNGHENLMRGGNPSRSQEAATSLASGKVVKELKLGMHISGLGDFTAVLNSENLNPRSLQLPQLQADDEKISPSTLLLTRIHYSECFADALDSLFSLFIKERTENKWEQEKLPAIHHWIMTRNKKIAAESVH